MTALEVFELMRCLDYFTEQGYGKNNRIGVVGLSYGGMYALHFSAMDVRIKSTISQCWFNDRAKQNWHDWTYFGSQAKFFDTEVASLVLPRKLYIGVGKYDQTFLVEDALRESERLINYAKRAGVENSLKFSVFDGAHELNKKDDELSVFTTDLGL